MQRIYGEDGILPSYVRYAAGDIPVERRSARQITGGVKMQLLQRGKSRRVDMLLDWLVCAPEHVSSPYAELYQEHGAFPAMESGNLRAIQVFVHADPEDRSRIIETYTFTVKYIRDADNHHVAAGIEVGRAGSHTISVGGTSRALQELVLRIDKLCGHLPHLPGSSQSRAIPLRLLTKTSPALRFNGNSLQRERPHTRWLDASYLRQAFPWGGRRLDKAR